MNSQLVPPTNYQLSCCTTSSSRLTLLVQISTFPTNLSHIQSVTSCYFVLNKYATPSKLFFDNQTNTHTQTSPIQNIIQELTTTRRIIIDLSNNFVGYINLLAPYIILVLTSKVNQTIDIRHSSSTVTKNAGSLIFEHMIHRCVTPLSTFRL